MSVLLESLQVSVGSKALFPPVNIQVQPGELLVVMGASGCGKSTLLSAIAGSLPRELTVKGTITLAGQRVEHLAMHQRGIGIQFQEDLLFPHLDVAGNLLFALSAERGTNGESANNKKQKLETIGKALQSAGLAGYEKRDIATLSGGQKARVSLLRSLLAKPTLLLLDEPFSRLDDDLRAAFRPFVFEQIKQMQIPAILVSHDRQDCPNDSFYALEQGQMLKNK